METEEVEKSMYVVLDAVEKLGRCLREELCYYISCDYCVDYRAIRHDVLKAVTHCIESGHLIMVDHYYSLNTDNRKRRGYRVSKANHWIGCRLRTQRMKRGVKRYRKLRPRPPMNAENAWKIIIDSIEFYYDDRDYPDSPECLNFYLTENIPSTSREKGKMEQACIQYFDEKENRI